MTIGCQDGSVIHADGTRGWPKKDRESLRVRTVQVSEADLDKHGIRTLP
jgi:hypothetical protein